MIHLIVSLQATHMKMCLTILLHLGLPLNMVALRFAPQHGNGYGQGIAVVGAAVAGVALVMAMPTPITASNSKSK